MNTTLPVSLWLYIPVHVWQHQAWKAVTVATTYGTAMNQEHWMHHFSPLLNSDVSFLSPL